MERIKTLTNEIENIIKKCFNDDTKFEYISEHPVLMHAFAVKTTDMPDKYTITIWQDDTTYIIEKEYMNCLVNEYTFDK